MRGTEYAELMSFLAVAEHGSFVSAAKTLGIATPTLSQTIRALEERLGVRLLNRTTRSVALTEAGEHLLAQARPAVDGLRTALDSVNAYRDTPAGTLRLSVVGAAATIVVAPMLGAFTAEHPAITLDVTVDDRTDDIVSGHFDAGMAGLRRIKHDMIAVRVSPESRLLAVASPDYLSRHRRPRAPQELQDHNCIRYRLTTGAIYRWDFQRAAETLEVAVDGSLITNDLDLVVRGALEGVGIGYVFENFVADHIAGGRLVPVLEDWARPFSGFHIFYTSKRHMPASLRALIAFLRARTRGTDTMAAAHAH